MQKADPLREKQPSPLIDQRTRDSASYIVLQAELRESKARLQSSLQEIMALKQNETTIRAEIKNLRTEVGILQERLRSSREEIKELRTSIDESVGSREEIQSPDVSSKNAQQIESAIEPLKREGRASGIFGNFFQRRVCPICGRRLGSQDRFCDFCGRPVPLTI
jgi:DNA repair exonuclease SbcCD ATPase subunit